MLYLISLCLLLFQTSNGLSPLQTMTVDNGECSMTDFAASFINDRATVCGQGQTHFFNGETRAVNSGVGIYPLGAGQIQNGYELTSCTCSQSATWTRTLASVTTAATTYFEWTWKLYGRKADCSLELKRDLTLSGCWMAREEECELAEGCVSIAEDCQCLEFTSPVVIDLDGDEVRMSSRAGGVEFDLDGNGERGLLPWTADGWLVLNDRGDFYVRDGRQFFGDRSAQPPAVTTPNGYTSLSVFDDNHDSAITPADGVWPLLAVWRDANWNGVSDLGEVQTLDSADVTSLSLDFRESGRVDGHGNEFRYRARVIVGGKERWSYDVFLSAR